MTRLEYGYLIVVKENLLKPEPNAGCVVLRLGVIIIREVAGKEVGILVLCVWDFVVFVGVVHGITVKGGVAISVGCGVAVCLVKVWIMSIEAGFEDPVAFRLQTDVGDLEIWADADDIEDLESDLFQIAVQTVANVKQIQCTKLGHVRESLQEIVLREGVSRSVDEWYGIVSLTQSR